MNDPDAIEAVLLQAAGVRRPSSMDISPILALIEEGYDLDQHILPTIRIKAASSGDAPQSWRWFVPAIRDARLKSIAGGRPDMGGDKTSTIDGDFADGERPVWWIRGDDSRYSSLAARWAAEKKQRRPAPIMSKYFKGLGWAFPAHWVL